MPGSVKHGKKEIKEWLSRQKDIQTIVDVGPGSGTYPKYIGSQYQWKAIEIWAPYVKQFHLNEFYTEIRIGDVRYCKFPEGDCVIFGDVLKHLEKKCALSVLRVAELLFPHVIVSLPLGNYPSEEHYSNPYEKHLSTWEFDEICKDYPFRKRIKDIGIFAR